MSNKTKILKAIALPVIVFGTSLAVAQARPENHIQPSGPSNSSYHYNFDFRNRTGQDANDFHIYLQTSKDMIEFYNNSPFGAPQKTSRNGDYFVIDYAGKTVINGQVIHLGWAGPSPVVNLSPVKVEANGIDTQDQPPTVWTYNGTPLSGQKIPNLGYSWKSKNGRAVLTLTNATAEAIHIPQMDFAIVTQHIPLAKLNWDPLESTLEWRAMNQAPLILAGTDDSKNPTTYTFEFPAELAEHSDQYLVYRVWANDGIDEENFIKALGEASVEQLIKDGE